MRKPWFLDSKRPTPQLRVSRLQFPLAPGFAVTAHIAQGQTLREGVIADFNIGDTGNPFTTYVAATRVTGRDKLLILRPFPAAPFQRGVGIGRAVLLQLWRGETINWEALQRKYTEERPCSECAERKSKNAYTVGQWKREDAVRICRECVETHRAAGEPYQCHVCQFWFPDEGFPTQYRHRQCSFYRVCLTCEQRKPCARCKGQKSATEYTASAWKTRHADRRICRVCATKSRGSWTCRTCRQVLPHQSFTAFRRRRPSGQNGTQVCDKCLQATVIKPIAAMAALRLSRSRQRERNKKILNEVRGEIATMVSARTRAGEAYPEPAPKRPRSEAGRDNALFSEAAPEPGRPPTPAGPEIVYTCPYCKTAVQSTVQNGKVVTRNHCGKQFRVKDGQVIRAYQHTCPHCGAAVASTKAGGRIRVQHTMPNGQPCKTTQWKASG